VNVLCQLFAAGASYYPGSGSLAALFVTSAGDLMLFSANQADEQWQFKWSLQQWGWSVNLAFATSFNDLLLLDWLSGCLATMLGRRVLLPLVNMLHQTREMHN